MPQHLGYGFEIPLLTLPSHAQHPPRHPHTRRLPGWGGCTLLLSERFRPQSGCRALAVPGGLLDVRWKDRISGFLRPHSGVRVVASGQTPGGLIMRGRDETARPASRHSIQTVWATSGGGVEPKRAWLPPFQQHHQGIGMVGSWKCAVSPPTRPGSYPFRNARQIRSPTIRRTARQLCLRRRSTNNGKMLFG
ncbi:uncharacterized protein K452DRAFT_31209 [Aplosporella prunicola CBS 121167]|uniref:Uncharacterized protein n=1 Tax=Aplosporella prunicola CBS 121167 TaxID=1176127 RepID=A0A6A6BDF6_9PEZI|nr:uncharacterized protein K452DRAFT_31209 [Aplosporella prunicola CBS 121167]KAF2141628.1 hypothetical protein K452DRAFT_31209 [Aplosporella prunicola CBS 121167]